jgi:hypothetical protein
MNERQLLGRSILLFDLKLNQVDRQKLTAIGDVGTPGIADLFVAVMGNIPGNQAGQAPGKDAGNHSGNDQGAAR